VRIFRSAAPTVAPGTRWTSAGHLTDPRLNEISGVVASRAHPGTLWVHNDSGDGPRIFAVSTNGAFQGELQVDGATANDWEDISFGPGPAGSTGDWIYVADTGNNFYTRATLAIYRFAEPSSVRDGRVGAQRLDVRFDDGDRHNIEAMFVDPRTSDTMLVTKSPRGGRAKLFRIGPDAFNGASTTAHQVAELDLGAKVTGADISPDGARIAIRTEGTVAAWTRGAGDTIAQAVGRTPVRVRSPKSESVAFTPDGSTWYSVPEGEGASIDVRAVPSALR
jgi:hypothetical protein